LDREIIRTDDGSTTIRLKEWEECYHSKNGAIQEAIHVFIKNGLSRFDGKPISILEIGFGTGLNAFITFLESSKIKQTIEYVGIEGYPISEAEWSAMNYVSQLDAEEKGDVFSNMHKCPWEVENYLSADFLLLKRKMLFKEIRFAGKFDLIYFDAFGFGVQPELWDEEIFKIMFASLKHSGMLVTYAARGIIKRNMVAAGFEVRKVPGPPGKREMMLAFKNFATDAKHN
jgi:tRNA U34 5-methylaminomethyl-2-thiouridine-forming methyltransferase MnmC